MLCPIYTNQFKKDLKHQQRRGKDMQKIKDVMTLLSANQELPARLRDHSLRGEFKDFKECHIESDWLLIYKMTENNIYFTRRIL